MRIFKWSLDALDTQYISLPLGAKILTVQMQKDRPQLWALCDETVKQYEARCIAIYGTGNPMPKNPGSYIATFQLGGGALVFHAFDVMNTVCPNCGSADYIQIEHEGDLVAPECTYWLCNDCGHSSQPE